jgi:hypothetical protein
VGRRRIDGQLEPLEVIPDPPIVVGMHPHAHGGESRFDIATEDLDHADLARSLGLVLEADHPERDHDPRVSRRPEPGLDDALARRMEPHDRLLLAHYHVGVEPMLPDRATQRAGEHTRLDRRRPHRAVPLGTPGRLVGVDAQPQATTRAQLVPGLRSLPRAPLRQVDGQPQRRVEVRAIERVLPVEHMTGAVEALG